MHATTRRRTAAAVVAIAVHFGLILLLLLGRAPDPVPPTDTAMQVSLVPAIPRPKPADHPAPAPRTPPILHRPAQARAPQLDTPPLFTAPTGRLEAAPPAPPAPGPKDAAATALQRALRNRLGCSEANLAGLTDAERDACQERLGKDVANARPYPVISPKLKNVFDGVVECKPDDEWCLYRLGKGPYPGLRGMMKKKKKSDWD